MTLTKFFNLETVSYLTGMSRSYILQLSRTGKLKGHSAARAQVWEEESVKSFIQHRRDSDAKERVAEAYRCPNCHALEDVFDDRLELIRQNMFYKDQVHRFDQMNRTLRSDLFILRQALQGIIANNGNNAEQVGIAEKSLQKIGYLELSPEDE